MRIVETNAQVDGQFKAGFDWDSHGWAFNIHDFADRIKFNYYKIKKKHQNHMKEKKIGVLVDFQDC